MKLYQVIIGLSLLAVSQVNAGEGHNFGYTDHDGPQTWSGTCKTGGRQSPVDISSVVVNSTIPLMAFGWYGYTFGSMFVRNDGHGLKFDGFDTWGDKRPFIQGGPLTGQYDLEQFHIHWAQDDTKGSEHTIKTKQFPAEIHFVHRKRGLASGGPLTPGSIAVVGVFVSINNHTSSKSSPIIQSAIRQVTDKPGQPVLVGKFSMGELLPTVKTLDSFYTYEGSLTTPGCDEVVTWTLLANPLQMTYQELDLLRQTKIGTDLRRGSNFRPTQPLNGRKISYRPGKIMNSWKDSTSFIPQFEGTVPSWIKQ